MSEEKGIIGKITDAAASAGGFLKSAFGTVKEIQDLHVDYATKEKTYELLDKMHEAKNQLMEFQDLLISAKDRIIELEGKLKQKEDWSLEAPKYELVSPIAGSFIYTIKESERRGQPKTYLCPRFYNNGVKSMLQFLSMSPQNVGHALCAIACSECKSSYQIKVKTLKEDLALLDNN